MKFLINALLMMALFMDAHTRFCILFSFLKFSHVLNVVIFSGVLLCSWYFRCELHSLENLSLPSFLLAMFFLHLQGSLILDVKRDLHHRYEANRLNPLLENHNILGFDPISVVCLQIICFARHNNNIQSCVENLFLMRTSFQSLWISL